MRKIIKRFFVLLSICSIIFCIAAITKITKNFDYQNVAVYAFTLLLGIILIAINIVFLGSLWADCD